MLDNQLKPYLLEVNHSPSLHTASPLDYKIKHDLIMDMMRVIDLDKSSRHAIQQWHVQQSQARLYSAGNSVTNLNVNIGKTSRSTVKLNRLNNLIATNELLRVKSFERLLPLTHDTEFHRDLSESAFLKLKQNCTHFANVVREQVY